MNKVILHGRIARDPEVRTTQSGKSVARTAIAVERRGARRQDAPSNQPTADFIQIIMWERLADFASRYLVKGSPVLIEGRLQVRSYEDSQGQRRTSTEVIVDNIEFAGPRPQGAAPVSDGGYSQNNNYERPNYAAPAQGAPSFPAPPADDDDDVPF